MNYTPALHFTQENETDLKKVGNDDIAHLNTAIHLLGEYECIFRDNNFEYERDVFHETRCILMQIRDYGRIDKNENYMVARKDTIIPEDK